MLGFIRTRDPPAVVFLLPGLGDDAAGGNPVKRMPGGTGLDVRATAPSAGRFALVNHRR